MIGRVLNIDANSTSYCELIALLLAGELESDFLDFKRELPSKGNPRKELAKDAVAFANASGGLLIFGVVEEDDRATSIQNVPIGEAADSMLRAIDGLVLPRIQGVQTWSFPTEPGSDVGLLVLGIPASPLAPHCVQIGPSLGFWRRVGRQNIPLSENDVERAYRERWRLLQDVAIEADKLATRLKQHSTPCFWWTATPLSSRGRVFTNSADGLRGVETVLSTPALNPVSMGQKYWTATPRFRRIEVCPLRSGNLSDSSELAIVLDTGAVATAFSLHDTSHANFRVAFGHENEISELPSWATWIERLVEFAANSCDLSRKLWDEYGLAGEVLINYGMHTNVPIGWFVNGFEVGYVDACNESIASEVTVSILSLRSQKGFGQTVGAIVSDLASGFGLQVGPHSVVNDEGAFVLNMSSAFAPNFAQWSKDKGLVI